MLLFFTRLVANLVMAVVVTLTAWAASPNYGMALIVALVSREICEIVQILDKRRDNAALIARIQGAMVKAKAAEARRADVDKSADNSTHGNA